QAVIDKYINGTSLPIAPAPENGWNTPPLTDIPVKFHSDPEKQREQIGTQKWLAVYPNGMEAWAEMRRSGYPKMYPLIHSDNNDLEEDEMIRRIVFLDIERQSNGNAVEKAEALLGPGGDKVSTRLWWDAKP
ncbi:MAG TPA: SusD/RagB family nutrient-binding outer membrane lipoprotein, partial [Cyclobacteriaceae bacterium]|nr:SusD/RagB family nutrient-binding outer membrane lipoprotein [Cyclobacteriaceae bacterium]